MRPRPAPCRRVRFGRYRAALADPREDVGDFFRSTLRRCPVCPAGLHQTLVVAGRDVVADEDEEQRLPEFSRDRDHTIERRRRIQHDRKQDARKLAIASRRFGRAFVISSIRLTMPHIRHFVLMRCSRSFNRAESILELNRNTCIVPTAAEAHLYVAHTSSISD